MGGRRSPARSAPVSPAPRCAKVNIVELEEEAGSLWRRRRSRRGREEVPCLQIRCRRFGVWSVLVLVAALERWGADRRPRWGAVRRAGVADGGVGAGARRGRGRWPASGGVEAKGAVPRAWVEAAISLQCLGEERESPGMGGEGVVTPKRGKGSSSCWTPYSARFSLILGMRHWIQQQLETVLALKNTMPPTVPC
jgi:hypothetical protein